MVCKGEDKLAALNLGQLKKLLCIVDQVADIKVLRRDGESVALSEKQLPLTLSQSSADIKGEGVDTVVA